MAPQPRPYVIEEYTRTVCPQCAEGGLRSDAEGTFIDGMLVSHDGAIWMHRFCPVHGKSESLYEEDAELWRSRRGWQTPTLEVVPDRRDNWRGFPDGYRHGLPAGHGQHSCILLLNVIEHCNMACPTCYATALAPGTALPEPLRPTMEEMLRTVDTALEREGGQLSVVMLSGGEPTLRRDLSELIDHLVNHPITRVMLNSNGRRIARDPGFIELLEKHRKTVEVYLQFDGFEESTYLQLRGEPLAEEKMLALQKLGEAKVFTTLVMAVKRGVNEHELPQVLQYGLDHPYVSGLAIQPVFGSGRNSGIDPHDRTTPTGVQKRLAPALQPADFIPLPCSHRDCCDIAYLLQDKKGDWRSLVQLTGRDELKNWIHLASNTIAFENIRDNLHQMVKQGTLQRLFSEQQAPSSLRVAKDLVAACDCIPGLTDLLGGIWNRASAEEKALEKLATKTFRVTIKQFMDAHTFHEARIRQCCVHVGSFEEDPRRTSFCWRWLFDDATDFPERASTLPMR